MIDRFIHKSVTWYDVVNPTTEEVRELLKEVRFPAEFSGDLTTMIPRSDVHATKSAFKTTLDFPIVRRTDINHPHEIKFIATKSALITIRFEDVEALHRYGKEFEVLSMLSTSRGISGGVLFISLVSYLYDGLEQKLDYLENRLRDIEEEVFNGKEKEMVHSISEVGRRIITFRQTLMTHESVMRDMPEKMQTAFGKKTAEYVSEIISRHEHALARIRSVQRSLEELRETNTALLTIKQNEIMKILTIMAFITFPLTLFTSLFGMNTDTTPILGRENDFWIIVGIMGVVSIAFFAFFRYKRWM